MEDDTVVRYDEIVGRARAIMVNRNKQYGSSYRTALGLEGIGYRMADKLARVRNMVQNKTEEAGDEKILDNLLDLLNYAALAVICYEDAKGEKHV